MIISANCLGVSSTDCSNERFVGTEPMVDLLEFCLLTHCITIPTVAIVYNYIVGRRRSLTALFG